MTQSAKPAIKDSIRSFILWFCVFYLIFWAFSHFFGGKQQAEKTGGEIQVSMVDKTLKLGNLAEFVVKNNTDKELSFTSPCVSGEAADSIGIYGIIAGNRTDNLLPVENCTLEDIPSFTVAAGGKQEVAFRNISHEIFTESGNYIMELSLNDGEAVQSVVSPDFKYSEPGVFRKLYRALVAKPLFNTLVFFIKILPGHPVGWAIVLLTVLVKVLLFTPNQRAMRSQREMQKMQPKISDIRAKYKDNPQVLAMKTMELYKTHKINPMGAMVPMLIQFPVLIGMYLIVQQGISPHQNYLLYGFNNSLDLSIVNNAFFWLDVTKVDPYFILPVLVAVIQFLTMKLSFAKSKSQEPKDKSVKKKSAEPNMADMAQQMQTTMVWVMPVMIGVFTAMFPAGVGIYWFTSTLLGAAQQKLVNWSLDRPQVTRVN